MKTNRGGTQLIDRGIAILDVLSRHGSEGLRAAAVAQMVGLNAATTYRILTAFERHGWVDRGRTTRRYRLGVNVFALGARAADGVGMRRVCRPTLLNLTAQTEDTVFLLVRSGLNIVCVDLCQGAKGILARMQYVGAELPLGVGTGSHAIMAFLPDEEVRAILTANSKIYKNYNTSEDKILNSIKSVQIKGYSVTRNNEIKGLAAIAMPIRARGHDVVASISINMFDSRLSDERLLYIISLLREGVTVAERGLQTAAIGL